MKIAIVGSRKFKDRDFVENRIPEILRTSKYILISGGAKGIDSWAKEMADFLGCKSIIFKANWKDLSHPDAVIKNGKYGQYDAMAGFRRNQVIVDEADKIVAFWDGKSSGTKDTIDRAIRAGKPLDIYVRN